MGAEIDGVWEDTTNTMLARVVGADAATVVQANVTRIEFKAFDLSIAGSSAVASSTALTISEVIFDTLQTDDRWTKDTTGYNFAHLVPSTVMSKGGHRYQIEYMATFSDGTKAMIGPFRPTAKAILGS